MCAFYDPADLLLAYTGSSLNRDAILLSGAAPNNTKHSFHSNEPNHVLRSISLKVGEELTMVEQEKYTLEGAHEHFAKLSNGEVWKLLGEQPRSSDLEEKLILAAYTSLYHWQQIGTSVHAQRGHWLLSHVLALLGHAELSLHHAQRCSEITDANQEEMRDFDLAYAKEGLARAYAARGERDQAGAYFRQARTLGERIKDDEDQKIFMDDLMDGNWEGIA